jgi:hypothetical protein
MYLEEALLHEKGRGGTEKEMEGSRREGKDGTVMEGLEWQGKGKEGL